MNNNKSENKVEDAFKILSQSLEMANSRGAFSILKGETKVIFESLVILEQELKKCKECNMHLAKEEPKSNKDI